MSNKTQKKLDILRVLKEAGETLTSVKIVESLNAAGQEGSDRTTRQYLKEMDEEGLTRSVGRRGRHITSAGLTFLHSSQIVNRLGYLSAKIDMMTYRMTFDLPTCSGAVVVNTSVVCPQIMYQCVDKICSVFHHGYAMGNRVALLAPGEKVGELVIPADKIGFCTVCSITLNGVMLKHGIPMASRFSGLMELREGHPFRFAELINYDGTTIDPLDIFIRAGMTDNLGAIDNGKGLIGAAFREMPGDSREMVTNLAERLERIGLGGFMKIGMPSQPVLEMPVSEGRIGAVVIGGLNPIAIITESGHRVYSHALSGLLEYGRLFHYSDLPEMVQRFC